MGLHLKDQHNNSQLQSKLVHDLDQRLHEKGAHRVPAHVAPPAELSLSYVWTAIFIIGGLVAIFMSLLEHKDPSAIGNNFSSGLLAVVGVIGLAAGVCTAVIGKHAHRQKK